MMTLVTIILGIIIIMCVCTASVLIALLYYITEDDKAYMDEHNINNNKEQL